MTAVCHQHTGRGSRVPGVEKGDSLPFSLDSSQMGPERKRTAALHFLQPHLALGCPMVSGISNLGEVWRLGAVLLSEGLGALFCGASLSIQTKFRISKWDRMGRPHISLSCSVTAAEHHAKHPRGLRFCKPVPI